MDNFIKNYDSYRGKYKKLYEIANSIIDIIDSTRWCDQRNTPPTTYSCGRKTFPLNRSAVASMKAHAKIDEINVKINEITYKTINDNKESVKDLKQYLKQYLGIVAGNPKLYKITILEINKNIDAINRMIDDANKDILQTITNALAVSNDARKLETIKLDAYAMTEIMIASAIKLIDPLFPQNISLHFSVHENIMRLLDVIHKNIIYCVATIIYFVSSMADVNAKAIVTDTFSNTIADAANTIYDT